MSKRFTNRNPVMMGVNIERDAINEHAKNIADENCRSKQGRKGYIEQYEANNEAQEENRSIKSRGNSFVETSGASSTEQEDSDTDYYEGEITEEDTDTYEEETEDENETGQESTECDEIEPEPAHDDDDEQDVYEEENNKQEQSEDEDETNQDRGEPMDVDDDSQPENKQIHRSSLSLSTEGCGCIETLSCSELDIMYRLAGTDTSVREKTLDVLKTWLSKVADRVPDIPECREVVESNFNRLWKTLLHGMWSATNDKAQDEIAESISDLHDTFSDQLHPYLVFVEMFVRLMAREWSWRSGGKENKRKFQKLFQHCTRKTIGILCKIDWRKNALQGFSKLISHYIFNRFSRPPQTSERILLTPLDFQVHFSKSFIKVVAEISGELNRQNLYTLLFPFLQQLRENKHISLTEQIRKQILATNVLPQYVGPLDIKQLTPRVDFVAVYKRLQMLSENHKMDVALKASVTQLETKIRDSIVAAKFQPRSFVYTRIKPFIRKAKFFKIITPQEKCKKDDPFLPSDPRNQANDSADCREIAACMRGDIILTRISGYYDNFIQFEMAQLDVEFTQVCDYIKSVKMHVPVPKKQSRKMKRKYKSNDEPERLDERMEQREDGMERRDERMEQSDEVMQHCDERMEQNDERMEQNDERMQQSDERMDINENCYPDENSNLEDNKDEVVRKKPKIEEPNEHPELGIHNGEVRTISIPSVEATDPNLNESLQPKNKSVHFVLAKNTSHEYSDYMYRLKRFREIPYDKNRLPSTGGLLKTKKPPVKKVDSNIPTPFVKIGFNDVASNKTSPLVQRRFNEADFDISE